MREFGRRAKNAVDRLAFNAWLRSGSVPDDLIDLARELDEEDADDIEHKFNPYGSYHFSGQIAAKDDPYDFNDRDGRSTIGKVLTKIGQEIPGVPFTIHVIGSKPFSGGGRW